MTIDAWAGIRRRRLLGVLAASALAGGCSRPTAQAQALLGFEGLAMGSTWSVRIAGGPHAVELQQAARSAVEAALADVQTRMSTFDADSELSRFNRHAGGGAQAVSPALLAVLDAAQQVAALTDGAFDITVAPLVGAWGFGAGAAARDAAPAADRLAAAPVGWRALQLDLLAGRARKLQPELALDLSGIAKGRAVDLAAEALDGLGLAHYMVEAGGELRTRGHNAQGQPWQIGIEQPDAWPRRARRVVPLSGLAMATSGDYRDWYARDGERLSHEIDPATRAPVRSGLASATVVHAQAMWADALATAMMVLGPERSLALARRHRLAVLLVQRGADGGLRDLSSPAFDALKA